MEDTHPNAGANPSGADATPEQAGDEAMSRLLAEYETKLGEMRDLLMRERAEIDNQRKRMQRDLDQARRFANERLLSELLPICDNLERGLGAGGNEVAALRAGIELTLKELLRVTAANGLTVVDPLGQAFDPERHQAMNLVETAEQDPDTVVAVLQKGYVLNDRLLRPAMVSVAKAPD